jgi:hypothetical protein
MGVHSRPHSPKRQAFNSTGVHSRPQQSTANGSQLGSQVDRASLASLAPGPKPKSQEGPAATFFGCSPSGLPMADRDNPGKIGEGPQVSAHYRSIGGPGGRCNKEIVGTTRATLLTDCGQ